MKIPRSLFAALLLVAMSLPVAAELPPLIDRELFFGDPEITGAQLSPDGKFIAFIKPLDGTRNVWVKRTDEPFDKAHPITADPKRPIPGYSWTQDGKYVLFVQDKGGDENYNVFAVDPAAKPAEGAKVPAARNLTDVKGARAFVYSAPESDPDTIYVGINERDKAWHDLYRVKISTGERTLVRNNTDRISGWTFDHKGNLRLAQRSAENGDTEILRVDGDKLEKIYSCTVFEGCGIDRFHKDDKRVYLQTNKGDRDLTQLVLLDPATGKEELVATDPHKRVDVGNTLYSDKSEELVGVEFEDDRSDIVWFDKAYQADYEWLRKQFPGRDVNPYSSTEDERLWLVSANGDTEPGQTYLYDRASKKLTPQYRVREKLVRDQLAPMQAIRYKSSDGLEIPAFLTLPKGVPAKNLPLVVLPHGGPWGRDTWGYGGFPQFLANRGYAVLQSNFRASTGYGKKFLNAGNKQWGELMQDDLTWGVKHLVAQGTVDPKRVGIMGGSYGGYATLAGLAFTPDVYAAGVSIVGPSNLITLLDSIPPYWESIRKMFVERMGDANSPVDKARMEKQSPLNSADKIKSPLLVIQGANDPRVKKAESDQIVVALRDRGFPVEYIVAPDEGHGFQRPVNNMAAFATAEKFLAKHLNGRYQESMSPEVTTRLGEITVDVKSVEKPKRVATVSVPKPTSDLAPSSAKYKIAIGMGGQTMNMDLASEIVEEGSNWVATDTIKGPMGEIKDRVVMSKGTLVPSARTATQGPVTIELAYTDKKATGTMNMGGQARPIDADLGGLLFADGAGMGSVIGTLPLADGYTATYRNFDVQKGKEKTMQLRVAGSESVTVPAGTFDAWKVEILPVDEAGNMILWIDKASHKNVKTTAVIASMGGATMTQELIP
ncbi:MAG TPA: prolyl oligopeptidase family serine peptidase [Thermoanaerobaculia bacterium]|jgi:dipeptidyl aminopeptidase/acylaminoacyl peptidase